MASGEKVTKIILRDLHLEHQADFSSECKFMIGDEANTKTSNKQHTPRSMRTIMRHSIKSPLDCRSSMIVFPPEKF
jgi:hypothetical protein